MPNNVRHGKRFYKQMSLEVAVRNPERFEGFLRTFAQFDGQVLDDTTILEMYSQLFVDGVVESSDLNDRQRTNRDFLKSWIITTRSHNNEWGFPTGYQAAFVRYLKSLSEFGFIYGQYNDPFLLSPIAKAVLDKRISLSEAFAIQSMRFWRKSPYRRVLNDFNFFDFIMQVILRHPNKRLSYPQFLASLFSDNDHVDEFLNFLSDNKIGDDEEKAYYAVKRKYSGLCQHDPVHSIQTAFRDYGNTVFRVLQLTGFITVEYNGIMLLSPNKSKLPLYQSLHDKKFTISEEAKEDELSYFKEIGSFPNDLYEIIQQNRKEVTTITKEYDNHLPTLISTYGLTSEIIKRELLNITNTRYSSCFWFIQPPVKFEFLLTLFAYSIYGKTFKYRPNFLYDDSGIPYSHAPGNMGDIEVFNEKLYWLIEATLIQSKNQQINNETVNLFRHIKSKANEKFLTLVAPYVHDDTKLIFNVATLITIMESKKINLYSKAETTREFVDGMGDNYFQLLRTNTQGFLTQVKRTLNKVSD